ncbi:RidA family protein [Novosphingobium pentaromativorans]|uniref:Transcription regulator n=1 Tax=Novosphingobium pentaromativorans US6-1 TaxID=1088721 RepID=G6EGN3_9SPHN|nr:RidA family protein [Novosphingobium pentaromativorans]AIT82142.1 endoribonuclease L-PSP [Novosphingobium pentaromativorans US6-1]EHJ59580.1 transcription regulator [Novosphingobium pentaromativorans US6-1]
MDVTPEERLAALGLDLPPPPQPAGQYRPARLVGDTLYLSGQGPRHPDGSFVAGRLGEDVSTQAGRTAARDAGLRLLSAARHALGNLSRIAAVGRVFGMVHAAPGFTEHAAVIDGCSELFISVLGEAGHHSRSVAGLATLPYGMIVQIDAVLHILPKEKLQ